MENLASALPTRRGLLLSTVAGAALVSMGQLSSCSSTTVLPAVIDVITKIVATTCQIIPVVTTLVDIIVAIFPAAAGVGSITDALAQQIAQYVCTLFQQAGVEGKTAPAAGFRAKLKNGAEIPLHGYRIVNGQMVYF
jgi:hypothetical protein